MQVFALGGAAAPRPVPEAAHVGAAQADPGSQQAGPGSGLLSLRYARGGGLHGNFSHFNQCCASDPDPFHFGQLDPDSLNESGNGSG